MSLITIDGELCKRDGFCVDECPMKIIEMKEDSCPETVAGAEELCIDCGHCLAVCPHGALTLRDTTPEQCEAFSKDALPDAEQVRRFMIGRRSVRAFKKKKVERELIEKCIDIARYAPSGHNKQPVKWMVIHDTGEANKLAGVVADWMRMIIDVSPEMTASMHLDLVVEAWDKGVDKILRGAPHVVVAYGERSDMTAQAACTIALSWLELAATSMGIGATWAGFFHAASAVYPPMQQALGLPEGYQSFGAVMLGYSKYSYKRIPPRNEASITWR